MQTSEVDGLDDLFGKSVYLAWLPGETLFSLISRHHFFWGHPLSSRTCMQFYGHARAGSQHDFPSRLARFEELTQARYGYAETIAGQHTLLAYYAPFLRKSDFRNAIATMSSDNVSHLKFRLGILTSRFRANHPLKACPACIQEDRVVFGWAYWHMDHQYPGVWICLKHGQLLRESMLKATGVERFQWHLPTEDQFRKVATESLTAIHNVLPELRSLSRLVLGLVTPGSEFTIDTSHLHELYKSEMARRGWLTKGGSCRMPEIAARFLEFVQPFRTLPELSTLPSNVTESATQLGRLLRPPRSGTHPLRHLLLIHWFFGTAGTFLSEYSKLLTQTVNVFNKESACICDVGDEQPDPRHAQLFNLVSTQNLSMRMAAKTLGVDVGTAMAWAAKAGLSASRRPKKLTVEIRKQAILELQKGYDKIVVARNANVSPVTITKLLFSEVGLQIAWRSARSLDAQTSARQKWLIAIQQYAYLGIKYIRALDPAVYAWLYRNDRVWLDEHKPERLENSTLPGARRQLWDERDAKLGVAIRQAALAIQIVNSHKKIKLWQLFQAVPDLKSKLSSLNQLPLTRQAIDQALLKVNNVIKPDLFD